MGAWLKAVVTGALMGGLAAGPVLAQSFNEDPPNNRSLTPAFEGQTRGPVIADATALRTTTFAEGLENPWGMALLPDGSWLVTERPGRMRLVGPNGAVSGAIAGLPEVHARRQGGLLDVAVQNDFAETRQVWWSYAEPRGRGESATAVATGVLSADGRSFSNVRVIFQQQPAWDSGRHFGSRLVFDPEGALFVTTGDRGSSRVWMKSQDPGTHIGKVVRIRPEGGSAQDTAPFAGGLPEVWSSGHRNIQAAALDLNGALWTVEHGPRGGDELNRPEPGLNYGWPVITYGEDYSGFSITDGISAKAGLEQPVYYWDPVIAPSGMVFYDGALFPQWRG
ncbi:MAG: PQQ-dependent sugar dehydrogenase, partial [Rhodospirillaceae bacterium]